MSRFDKPVFFLCLACFFATLLIHCGTFFFTGLNNIDPFVPFHFIVIAAGGFVALRYRNAPKSLAKWAPPLRVPFYILFAYFLLTMALMYIYFEGGSPTVVDGKPQLSNHGRFIRYLTDEEFAYAQHYELRLFSCAWMSIFAGTAAYLAQLRENAKAPVPE
ncbi:MAG: hypothetical protein ABI972_23630 [Acidobacteriota bacterium]